MFRFKMYLAVILPGGVERQLCEACALRIFSGPLDSCGLFDFPLVLSWLFCFRWGFSAGVLCGYRVGRTFGGVFHLDLDIAMAAILEAFFTSS